MKFFIVTATYPIVLFKKIFHCYLFLHNVGILVTHYAVGSYHYKMYGLTAFCFGTECFYFVH